jgi:hypothetical protein
VWIVTSGAEQQGYDRDGRGSRNSLDEQVRRRGIHHLRSVDDLARDDVFESGEELDAFLVHVYAERQANLV